MDMTAMANDLMATMTTAQSLTNPSAEPGYRVHQYSIPAYMMPALRRYIDDGELPGDFLCAVLRNDLREACGRADDRNGPNLAAYIGYLYNEAPRECWGSPEKVAAWVRGKAAA